MPSRHRWVLAATILGSSMTFIDATVVNVALPALQADLHATITDVQWVIEAYALFLGALILVGGSHGRPVRAQARVPARRRRSSPRASIFCGARHLATRAHRLGRALQGFGAAFLVPGSLAIISATFDDAERGRAIGTWSGFSAITAAIGPVSGGWLIEHVSWRAVFFLNVPLAMVVLALSLRFMDESRDPSRTARIDWTGGAALAVLGLGGDRLRPARMAAARARAIRSSSARWRSGALALVLFVIVERRATNPMLPLALFRSRTFTLRQRAHAAPLRRARAWSCFSSCR